MTIRITTEKNLANQLARSNQLRVRKITVEVSHHKKHSDVSISCKDPAQIFWLAYHAGFSEGISQGITLE